MKTKKTKYYICGCSEDGGKTIGWKPNVYTEEELRQIQAGTKNATDGNWEIIVLSELEVEVKYA